MLTLRRFFPKTLVTALALVIAPAVAEAKSKKTAATVECKDGTTSKAGRGACSHHGGVAATKDAAPERADKPAATTKDAVPERADKPAAAPPAAPSSARDASRSQGRAAPTTERAPSAPNAGQPTARCKDGTMSYAKQHSGACSHHGGVAEWLK
jgi:hypothetical protein